MIRQGKIRSILTGGHFPDNAKFNKPVPRFTGGLFEFFEINNSNGIQSFLEQSALPNPDRLRCGNIYNNERQFFKYTQLEAYNKFGLPCTYYRVLYDVKKDPIFGEDSHMTISEMYSDVMVYCQIPRETKKWIKFGIDYTDNFPMYCSKEHFNFVSNGYIPQIGDYVLIDFSSNLYEIVEIKEEQAGFIQSKQYSWNFIVKPFRLKSNLYLDPSLANSNIARFVNVKDIFDITKPVEVKAENIMYKPKLGEKPQQNPWQSR